jgi:hypothetical protein
VKHDYFRSFNVKPLRVNLRGRHAAIEVFEIN